MMPARSAPDLQPPPQPQPRADPKHPGVYSYLQNKSGLNFAPPSSGAQQQPAAPAQHPAPVPAPRDAGSPPGAAPVRDSASLRAVRYGPGHEKFPSWPSPAAADAPAAARGPPSGGSSRSKSWTDRTAYPKERPPTYARPHARRQSSYAQQKLKTVMERCEKIPPETFESRGDKLNERLYLPRVNHDGKSLGDEDYMVPSPPERDISSKPQLTQSDLEEYARSYQDYGGKEGQHRLTESGLEEFMEYSRNYEDSIYNSMGSKHDENILTHIHQKQVSYAQSEGYHSYVSSTDSTSTPFLDRLRRDSEAVVRETPPQNSWDELSEREISKREGGRDSVVTDSSGSASSSETLKWHGSMSDVSVASSSCTHLANSTSSSNSRQLIAHSARVKTPQRHHSESVLYMGGEQEGWKDRENRNNSTNKLKLFAVNTYTVQDGPNRQEGTTNNTANNRLSLSLQSALSVADRISELEKQQKYSYLDPDKRHKIPDPALKAIQKKALLSFYERHHNNSNKNTWRSEPQLAQSQQGLSVPQPPPKVKMQLPSRRASSASDYASGPNSRRSSLASSLESKTTDNLSKTVPKHQHSNSCGSLSTDLLGPVIMGPSISVDDWVPPEKPPARPPKNPHLRSAFPDLFQNQRVPSPDLPPPSPPTVFEDEVVHTDEPLPPPPPECDSNWQQDFSERLKENNSTGYQIPAPQVQKSKSKPGSPPRQTVGIPADKGTRYSIIKTKPADQIFHQISSKPYNAEKHRKPEQVLDFPNQRGYAERSSARYPATQKLVLNGSMKVANSEQLRPSETMRREEIRKQLPAMPVETHRAQRASIAESPLKETPPPLQPRQMRINQSMRARIPADQRPGAVASRTSPPKDDLREARPMITSQSKASYLASRRDRNRIVPDSETGSYKRTMSPNGHAVPQDSLGELPKVNSRETVWPLKPTKDASILRRTSISDKHRKDKCDEKQDLEQPGLALPDVLPVNVKRLGPRSQQYNRPTQLSLSPLDNEKVIKTSPQSPAKSPPSSPPKSPSRGSPFSPLRTTSLSSSPSISSTTNSSPILRKPLPSPVTSTPNTSQVRTTSTATSPQSPKRTSPPHIKPSLSPSSPMKLSPLRNSPSNTLSLASPLPLSVATPLTCSVASTAISSNSSQYAVSTPLKISSSTATLSKTEQSTSTSPPPSLKKEEYPVVLEGLQMIQRTEVVLRVNTSTTDASSQTEKEELPPTPLPTRKKLQEEIDCEKLSEDFVNHLPTSDRLKDLLVPGPDHKKPTDYVQGLFKVEITSRPRPANSPFRSRNNTPSNSPPPTLTPSTVKTSTCKLNIPPARSPSIEPTSPLSGTSIYFTTSEPKAKFLTRYSQDMNQCHVVKDTKDLSQKKEELVNRLDKKLEVLRSEALVVSEECKVNEELGENVENHLNKLASSAEFSKFKLHVEEIGKITSLLLGLSGRLARAENALTGMPENHPERRILESKRDKLLEQLEEAKKLKECIDRRSVSVSNILYKYLNTEEYADYDHFINMKAKLIMDTKEISDKIKLGEEQLLALKETLIVTD